MADHLLSMIARPLGRSGNLYSMIARSSSLWPLGRSGNFWSMIAQTSSLWPIGRSGNLLLYDCLIRILLRLTYQDISCSMSAWSLDNVSLQMMPYCIRPILRSLSFLLYRFKLMLYAATYMHFWLAIVVEWCCELTACLVHLSSL